MEFSLVTFSARHQTHLESESEAIHRHAVMETAELICSDRSLESMN